MGVGQSHEDATHASSPEQLSLILAERFATKCFTPLELTHFKDNFFTRATDQGGLKYWNEKTLSDFLGIPDHSDAHCPLDAGPVIFRMASYLGAFPFQTTLAPSVLTFEAMVKVAVLLTERYGKVLRRGQRNRIRLLFGSLADVGRREIEKPSQEEEKPEDTEMATSHAPGYDIDAPANDDYDEDDDDDLALAALEALDAIEVFKHDSRINRKVFEARISVDTFRRLLMLLIVIAPLKPLEDVNIYTSDLSENRMNAVRKEADNILAAFKQESTGGISYKTFADTISTSFPFLFDPLTPLFEHLLFSKNLDFSQKRGSDTAESSPTPTPAVFPRSITLPGSFESTILNSSVISHLSFFLPSTSVNQNLLHGNIRLHPVFSTSAHGSSLTSFSHNVLTWQSGTLLLLEGVDTESNKALTIGAYLPQPWTSPKATSSSTSTSTLPALFQLSPRHTLHQGNPSPSLQNKPNIPPAYFSQQHGISIGCQIPPPSRTQKLPPSPHGAGSLLINTSLEVAELHISPFGHDGIFLPPGPSPTTGIENANPSKTTIDIYTLEIWGLVPDPEASSSSQGNRTQSAVEIQEAKWAFEAREAERRRNINLKAGAGDSAAESARWLLETAGIIGDNSGAGRAGGST